MQKYERFTVLFKRELSEIESENFSAEVFDYFCQGISEENFPNVPPSLVYSLFFDEGFSKTEDCETMVKELKDKFPVAEITHESLENQDWSKFWRKYFHEIPIGKRVVVVPPWEYEESLAKPENKDRVFIKIDPGMAFGTGTHETTQMCLQSLEDIDPDGMHILDIGIGSGILAIGAIKLGAEMVDGVEVDPDAEENLRENLDINDVSADVNVYIEDAEEFLENSRSRYDFILCNMLSRHFPPVVPYFQEVLKTGDKCGAVLSGYLCTEKEEVDNLMKDFGFVLTKEYKLGEWLAGFYQRK